MLVREKSFYKTIFKIALPSSFQALVSFLVVVADDVMVSRLTDGVVSQAAVAQINSITALFTASVLGFVSGSSVLISQYWGKNDTAKIKQIFSCVLFFCGFFSIAVVTLIQFFPEFVAGLVVSKENAQVTQLALKYLAIVCFSYIPYAVSNSLVGMLRSVEVVKITLYISIVSLFVNISLNYVLMFGKLGFAPMGVRGAAIATVITRVVELILVWVYTFFIQKEFPVKMKDMLSGTWQLFADYVHYGLPAGLVDMQWAIIGMLKTAIIGRLGSVFMAANNITDSMLNLGTLFAFALANGACVVVGKAVGVGDYRRAKDYSRTIQIMFFGLGIIMAGVVYSVRVPFISLYGSSADPEVAELGEKMIALLALSLIFVCYHASCFKGINRGGGDSRFVAAVDSVCGWCVVLPATLLAAFVFKLPLPAVYFCTRIDQYFKWIIAMIRLRGDKWIKNVTRD